ncbi:hypothetical protein N5F23_00310 [Pseudomonas sichuanensis]|uniref:hypothetical protein n=1 Tax=Pseudomonas sichuanensis TaxID=2213015 RepID=UPI0024484DBA|nr:hypothetical protein [Pseudomonas sichuanensis]MDH0730989.1 hypothetical protein [Pseudomonas sichuanensis]MDH1581034.1 hypothetical protein [Pseudomonas sichuanensis]MDH1591105.1 hypothetical protein [Pseudomonas sichuanensis]MDH1596774.1 hypothetical protein [Pseudomonas sichuanensis]
MDYPESLPNAGLVGGKFVDEDPVAGTPGSLIPAAWGNAVTDEIIAVIEAAGLAPEEEDSAQLVKAIRLLQQGAVGSYAPDTGAANAYAAAYTPAVSALADGMVLRIKVANTNTGPATFAPNGLPAKPVLNLHHAALVAGDIQAGRVAWLQYNAILASWVSVLTSSVPDATAAQKGVVRLATAAEAAARQRNDVAVTPSSLGFPPGFIYGLTTANNAAAPNTTIDLAPGAARSSDDSVDIKLTSTTRGILQSSGAWAAGDNQNKLDSGARAPNTWYHPFVMRRTSDGQADHLWSASVTAPTVPPGYDSATRLKGRSIKTDGAGNIVPFINTGNSTVFKSLQQDMFVTNVATTSYTLTVSVPPGVRVRARFYARTQGESSVIYVRSPEAVAAVLGNTATDAFVGGIGTSNDATSNENVSGYCESLTNQSAQVVAQVFGYVGYNVLRASLHTIGWTEE